MLLYKLGFVLFGDYVNRDIRTYLYVCQIGLLFKVTIFLIHPSSCHSESFVGKLKGE